MKYLHLIWRSLMRKKVRTVLTVLSIMIAFTIFGYAGAMRVGFSFGVEVAGQDRLWTIHKVSLIQPLPLSYLARIRALPGVKAVAHATWFGGKYQDEREGLFGIFPVVPEEYMRVYPEFVIPEQQMKDWLATRTGAVVARKIAEQFGWKIGQRIPIKGTIFHQKDGSTTWEFDLVGMYDVSRRGADETQFLIHWKYFNEARDQGKDQVGWYVVLAENAAESAQIAASIDSGFANSSYETETTSEKAFVQGFANQMGNIGAILGAVLGAVFFTILLVAGSTMAQSVRERTSELAVLKTLGFSDLKVLALVLAESMVLAAGGGAFGLTFAWLLVTLIGDPTDGGLPVFFIPNHDLLIGVCASLAFGFITGVLPAIQATRLKIVDALRRV